MLKCYYQAKFGPPDRDWDSLALIKARATSLPSSSQSTFVHFLSPPCGQEQHVDVCASLSDELEAREYVDVTDIFSRTSTTSPLCVGSPPTAGRLPSDALESRIRALVAESVQQHLQQQQQSKQQQELDAASFGCAASERSLRTRHSAQESLRTRPTPHKNGLIVTGLF